MPIPILPLASRAIRELTRPNTRTDPEAATATLSEHVEHILFQSARMGPVDAILGESLELLRSRKDLSDLGDEALYDGWARAVDVSHGKFLTETFNAFSSRHGAFIEKCSIAFGIEAKWVHRLVQEFHDLQVGQRFGVLVLLSRSASFGYLEREIDDFTGTVELAYPDESLRMLIRRTLAVE